MHDHRVAIGLHFTRERAVDAVALEQQRVRLGIGEVVDRDQSQPAIGAFQDGARDEAADASETVDCDFHCHDETSFLRGRDRKSTRLTPSLMRISYAVFCLTTK